MPRISLSSTKRSFIMARSRCLNLLNRRKMVESLIVEFDDLVGDQSRVFQNEKFSGKAEAVGARYKQRGQRRNAENF